MADAIFEQCFAVPVKMQHVAGAARQVLSIDITCTLHRYQIHVTERALGEETSDGAAKSIVESTSAS